MADTSSHVMNATNLENAATKAALETKLGFQISTANGTAWPHTGSAGRSISAKVKSERLAAMSRATGLPTVAGMYIRFAAK